MRAGGNSSGEIVNKRNETNYIILYYIILYYIILYYIIPGPIISLKTRLACTLRWLASGSYIDTCLNTEWPLEALCYVIVGMNEEIDWDGPRRQTGGQELTLTELLEQHGISVKVRTI
jgi:hypothetical protein